jgi:pimeloyl-ACP methyl ester carboxylesterase
VGKKLADELRGAGRLAVEATRGVTDLVEAMHQTIAGGPDVLGRPLAGLARAFTAPVYGSIRGVTMLVGKGLDLALEQLAPLLGESAPTPEREAVLAAVNGVLGDYLEETHNPLALAMQLRTATGSELTLEREALSRAFPTASGKVLVLVHGSSMSDRQWCWKGHDHGARLAEDLGFTPLYLRYNSGLHIWKNGQAFAELLEALLAAWPVPVEALTLVGHSMGGLVARSACHFAEVEGLAWRKALRALVCLGTPHHGAPLERSGNLLGLALGVSRYSAPLGRLGRIRSAGVTDLRFGNVLQEHAAAPDRFAHGEDPRTELSLPDGVDCYAVAGTTATTPADALPGDGLVPVASALGKHAKPALSLRFPASHQHVAYGHGHLDLLSSPEVYARVRDWLQASSSVERP